MQNRDFLSKGGIPDGSILRYLVSCLDVPACRVTMEEKDELAKALDVLATPNRVSICLNAHHQQ